MHQQPRRAKRLYFDVIPRAVDEYLSLVEKLPVEERAKALENPAWHIHDGKAPDHHAAGVSFGMLLNLAGVAHTDDKDVLWQYLRRYVPGATPQNAPYLDRLLQNAIAYYVDFVKAHKTFRLPAADERAALADLADTLRRLPDDASAEFIQNEVYETGKRHFAQAELRQWFKTLYEVLLGSEQGPRMGAFIKLYGRDNVVRLIDRALAGENLGKAA
jgi:lysyl-tRNA synthetase class 1